MLDVLLPLDRGERLGDQRSPRLVVELGPVEGVDGPQAVEPERTGEPVDVVGAEPQLLGQTLDRAFRCPRIDLQADDGQEAAAAELLLQGEKEVVGCVVVQSQVGIAGDPEDAGLSHVHAGEQFVDEGHQRLLEWDEPVAAREGKQPGHIGRHLHPGESGGVVLPVSDLDAYIEREVRDIGEGMAGIDRQWGDHREDQPLEHLMEIGVVATIERFPVAQLDPLHLEGRRDLLQQQCLLAPDHPLQRSPNVGQQLLGRAAVEGQALDAGHHLAAESGHLDLEELVDPLAEEDQELDPLQQGDLGRRPPGRGVGR